MLNKVDVLHYVNSGTKLWVCTEPDGTLVASFKLGQGQYDILIKEGTVRGEISTDEYQDQVQRLYASLSGVRLRTGTAAANALDQVYVIADAWEATQDSDEPW